MRIIKSHSLFFAASLLLAFSLHAQENQEGAVPSSTTSETSPPQDVEPATATGSEQIKSVESTLAPEAEGPLNPVEDENLKYTKFGNKSLVWASLGFGSPGNGLDTPSRHIELGLDFPFGERIKWGPYLQMVSANKREAFVFPATGYTEVRKYLVSSNVLGVQSRILLYDVWQGRVGVGLSQTSMVVNSVSTNAPLPSTAEGYKKTFPLGFAAQAAIQRVWVLATVNVATELGYSVTAFNSNESFTEIYLAAVARFSLGSEEKRTILPRNSQPEASLDPAADKTAIPPAEESPTTQDPAPEPTN